MYKNGIKIPPVRTHRRHPRCLSYYYYYLHRQEITSKRSSETSRRGHIIANRPKNDQNHVSLTLQRWSPTTSHSLGIYQRGL
ncbi:hypothetical protein I7I50_12109 [Histoplasma capsulatum G186AR]|uniref:Uncharacterized protein n=1 Tax=Ajellomyces capsulatus TaxID=5037 RepID=A0A8H7YD98_AJECA|nr:hypothetical protein I7I52_11579 [Histoplasma capsulatum]QSS70471.1 hypothetical protein I7I50_12109 [Histoplasma capsulatum G186AR]